MGIKTKKMKNLIKNITQNMDKLTHLPLPLALTAGQVDIQPSSDWLVEAKQVSHTLVCITSQEVNLLDDSR